MVPLLEVAALQFVDRERRGARGQRHVGQRRVHARRRRHARAVGHEHVRARPTPGCSRSAPRSSDRGPCARCPSRGCPCPGSSRCRRTCTSLHAGGLEHLGHVVHHVLAHQAFVLAGRAVDRQHRQAPLVAFVARRCEMRLSWFGSISPNAVAPMRHGPGAAMRVLEVAADAQLARRRAPSPGGSRCPGSRSRAGSRACRRRGCGSAGCRSPSAGCRSTCGPRTRRRRRWRRSGSDGPSGCGRARRELLPRPPGHTSRRRAASAATWS